MAKSGTTNLLPAPAGAPEPSHAPEVSVASEFDARVAVEATRRIAGPSDGWRLLSPTDTRNAKERARDIDTRDSAEFAAGFGGFFTLSMSGAGVCALTDASPVGLAAIAAGPFVGVLNLVWWVVGNGRPLTARLNRRVRAHEHAMRDAYSIPVIAADAYDSIHEAPRLLASLNAPDVAVEFAVNARTDAVEALEALGRLTRVDSDKVWLSTTEPYQHLITLAAETTVLAHLCRNRRALPYVDDTTVPHGLESAAEVGAYLLSENVAVAQALTTRGG